MNKVIEIKLNPSKLFEIGQFEIVVKMKLLKIIRKILLWFKTIGFGFVRINWIQLQWVLTTIVFLIFNKFIYY